MLVLPAGDINTASLDGKAPVVWQAVSSKGQEKVSLQLVSGVFRLKVSTL